MSETKKTETVKSLVAALAMFQSECPAISKEKKAGQGKFQYKYGSLPMILEVIKPHMKKAGLCFTQPIITDENGKEFIITTIYHADSGEDMSSNIHLPDIKFQGMNELQSKGSSITYLRRYALMSILGLVTEEDDNDAQGKTEPKAQAQPQNTTRTVEMEWLNPLEGGQPNPKWNEALKYLAGGGTITEIKAKYKLGKANEEKLLNEAVNYSEPVSDVQPGEANTLFDEQGNLIPE